MQRTCDRDIGKAIAVGDVRRGNLGGRDPAGEHIGADIDKDLDLQGRKATMGVATDLKIDLHRAGMGGGLQILKSIFDPFHRPVQMAAGVGDDHLFSIRPRLRAEAAADVFGDDADLVLRESEEAGEVLPYIIMRLGREPRAQKWTLRIEIGNHASGLQRNRSLANEIELTPGTMGTIRECARSVAVMVFKRRRDIAGPFGMKCRCVFGGRIADGGDNRQRPVLDVDEFGQVFGLITIFRHDEGDRLADEAHAAGGEKLRQPVADARMPIAHDPRLIVEWQIARRQDRQRPGGASARRVDCEDVRVRHGTAHERSVRHPVQMNVVDEPGRPAQQPAVLLAQRWRRFNVHGRILSRGGKRRPLSAAFIKILGPQPRFESGLSRQPFVIEHGKPCGVAVASLLDHVLTKNAFK